MNLDGVALITDLKTENFVFSACALLQGRPGVSIARTSFTNLSSLLSFFIP
jgi:hypothetical protein